MPAGRMETGVRRAVAAAGIVFDSVSLPSFRPMANALTVTWFSSPTRSVSLVEDKRVPAAFRVRARPHLVDAGRHLHAGLAIDPERVDAAAVAGRQVDLRRQGIAKRRAERAGVREGVLLVRHRRGPQT